jgi:hypothetical protein
VTALYHLNRSLFKLAFFHLIPSRPQQTAYYIYLGVSASLGMDVSTRKYPRCHCDGFQYFLDLPRELRNHVYRFVVAGLPSRIYFSSRVPLSEHVLMPETLPNIAFASHQLRRESILIYLQRTRLVFDGLYPITVGLAIQPLEGFLTKYEGGFESIRMLTFFAVTQFGRDSDLDEIYPATFLSRYTGLQDLVIESRWDLSSLFSLVNLKTVKFRCAIHDWQPDDYKLGTTEQLIANLNAVLQEGFKETGRSVVCTVESVRPR